MFDLTGKTALVTGAGRGVGAEIARRFAAQGAGVAINDLFEDRAGAVAAEISDAGGSALPVVADVTDKDSVARMVREVQGRLGSIDILVCNAGVPVGEFPLVPFVETGPEEWSRWLDLNVGGVLLCVHAVLEGMVARGWGRVITVASDAARTGEPYMAVYAASKGASVVFTKSIAREVGATGVTCNCLVLGTMSFSDDPDVTAQHARRYPTARLGTPEDVAPAALWLASPEASWVTGQVIPVNGGYTTI